MSLWFGFFLCLFFGLKEVFRDGFPGLRISSEISSLCRTRDSLHHFEETLASGCLPDEQDWALLRSQPAPWGGLISESLIRLRSHGASLVPTLKRFRELVVSHEKNLRQGKARASQALAQAMVCALMIPLFSSVLYLMVPGVDEKRSFWFVLSFFACLWGGLASLWMLSMSEMARWGGLKKTEQPWVLESLSFGERLLATLKAGASPDLAWTESTKMLSSGLVCLWGANIWQESSNSASTQTGPLHFRESIATLGERLRRSIQVSLMEGSPSEDRMISVIESFKTEMESFQERELSLLPARAMKPLFLCVAPAVMSLLVTALVLSFQSQAPGWF
jgi:hypothetical protein